MGMYYKDHSKNLSNREGKALQGLIHIFRRKCTPAIPLYENELLEVQQRLLGIRAEKRGTPLLPPIPENKQQLLP